MIKNIDSIQTSSFLVSGAAGPLVVIVVRGITLTAGSLGSSRVAGINAFEL